MFLVGGAIQVQAVNFSKIKAPTTPSTQDKYTTLIYFNNSYT